MTNKPDTATMRADLAKLCNFELKKSGLRIKEHYHRYGKIKCRETFLCVYKNGLYQGEWHPDSEESPSWQRWAILEAVQKHGLEGDFVGLVQDAIGNTIGDHLPLMLADNNTVCQAAWLSARDGGLL